jgi:hypothetical protein
MKRWGIILLLIALVAAVLTGFMRNDMRCRKTDDLSITGVLYHTDEKEALLSVTLYNKSDIHDYEHTLVNAYFYDANETYLGEFNFSIKYDVDAGETEDYVIWIDDADSIARVEYEIVCSEYD